MIYKEYDRIDERFSRVKDWEVHHKHEFTCPNPFIHVLNQWYDKIDCLKDINVFIETGTHTGWTTEVASEVFETVHTVEKNMVNNPYTNENYLELYRVIKNNHPNTNFNNGDSPAFLNKISSEINEQCVFLLDAHAPNSSPIIAELDAIKKFPIKNNVILVDDGVNIGGPGWPNREEFIKAVKEINQDYRIVDTQMYRGLILIYEDKGE